MSRKSTFKKLEENNGDVYKEVFDILLKVLDNVIKAPENIKYRKLRLSNEIVSNKLIPAIGALECLFDFGFQEVCNILYCFSKFESLLYLVKFLFSFRPMNS